MDKVNIHRDAWGDLAIECDDKIYAFAVSDFELMRRLAEEFLFDNASHKYISAGSLEYCRNNGNIIEESFVGSYQKSDFTETGE